MEKKIRRFYLASLSILLLLSAYPFFMGIRIIIIQLLNGGVPVEYYAKYVIPYTAICMAIIITVLFYPLISKLKRTSNITAAIFGLGLFTVIELFMESIILKGPIKPVLSGTVSSDMTAVDWQLFSCVGTPVAVQAFNKPYNDAFKIHYFLVSFILIVLIINIIYAIGKMIADGNKVAKIPLRLQLVTTVLLLGLCVYANLTGFYRDASDYLSPLSSVLTAGFFIILGVSSGIYAGSHTINKGKFASIFLPSAIAIVVCSIMYYGEYKLLGDKLYQYGEGILLNGLPVIYVSPMDLMIILFAGLATGLIMKYARDASNQTSDSVVRMKS